MNLENRVRNYERNTFHILYQTFCGKGAEVANKHSVIILRYVHCGVEYIFERTV